MDEEADGPGLRLFEGMDTSGLALWLTGTKTFANGVVQFTYVPGEAPAIRITSHRKE